MTRAILYDILDGLHKRHPMVQFRHYVDDLVAR